MKRKTHGVNLPQDYSKPDHDFSSILVMPLDFEHIPSFDEVNRDYSRDEKFPDYAKRMSHCNIRSAMIDRTDLH